MVFIEKLSLVKTEKIEYFKNIITIVTVLTRCCPGLGDIMSNNVFFFSLSFTSHVNIGGKMLRRCILILDFGDVPFPFEAVISELKPKEIE